MKVEKDGLKLLDDLEKLNGLPLEKKGTEIRKRLNIDENLLQKIEGISSPYILIEGDRDKAISLAAYIYLEKSTVYSDVYLHEEQKGGTSASPLRKAKKGENIYLGLWHSKNNKEGKTTLFTYCQYVNKKTGRYERSGRIDDYRYDLARADFYYKGNRYRPANAKGKPIEIIYENHFRYRDWEDTHPKTLNTLEIMDEGPTSGMTLFDMLKFKSTVFLLDFMKGDEDKDIKCPELLEFTKKLHALKKDTPGFLILHTDCAKNLPEYFLELFYVIPLDGDEEKEDGVPSTEKDKGKERRNLKDIIPIVVPDGTKWSDIKMGVDYYNKKLCIKVKGKNIKIGFLEFGLKDGRSKKNKPTDLLARLSEYAQAENNMIYTGNMKRGFGKLNTDTKRLNKLIRLRIKGIAAPPITYTNHEGFKSQFGELYLIHTDYDKSHEATTSELSDVPDPSSENRETLD